MKPTKPHAPQHHYSAAEMHNDDVAHEDSDINITAIVWSAVVVAVVCGTTALLMLLLFNFLEAQAKGRDPKMSPVAMPAVVMPPNTLGSPEFGNAPQPRLITSEPTLLKQLRTHEQEQLHGYGWVDQGAGVARIPIDEAKKLMLERGLPVRPDPTTDPRLGTHAPAYGESSSGRTIMTKAPVATAPAEPPPAPVGVGHEVHKG